MVLSTTSLRSGHHSASPGKRLTRLSLLFNKNFQDYEIKSTINIIDDVRIIPPTMIFKHAFEGKKYQQQFGVHNFGTKVAYIRIGQPTSSAFQTQDLHRGVSLSPGLSITRNVSFTYLRATFVPIAWIPIHINNQLIEYHFEVMMSEAKIIAIPNHIDFGTVDLGYSASVRKFELCNEGSKEARFDIDLGSNEIELIVEPCKGILHPFDKMDFRVECLGHKTGKCKSEFWVKCDVPLKIDVEADIICPKLQPIHRNVIKEFTLIDFPKTYFGNSCTRSLLINNVSNSPSMFCITSDKFQEAQMMSVKEAGEKFKNYNDFSITPLEGALRPQEGRLYQFTYTPIKDKTKPKEDQLEKLSFCSLRISHIPSTNLNDIAHLEIDIEPKLEKRKSIESQESLTSQSEAIVDDAISASKHELLILSFNKDIHVPTSMSLKLFLYGEAETARINIRPDSLHIKDMPVKSGTTRELLLTNCSSSLPIIVKYVKVCFVEVEPKFKILQPNECFEVCVTINAAKLGDVRTKVVFDLYYYDTPKMSDKSTKIGRAHIPLRFNGVHAHQVERKSKFNMGLTPTYVKEVGFNVDDIRFNYSGEFPKATLMGTKIWSKNDNEVVAFPNDRPKSLRPWKSVIRCRTICAGIPRISTNVRDSYQLTESQSATKHGQYSYYEKYTREQAVNIMKQRLVAESVSDYETSNPKDLLFNYLTMIKCDSVTFEEIKTTEPCIPLTPLQLNKITVLPTSLHLGKMSSCSYKTEKIKIINSNDFPINIISRARKHMIEFPRGRYKKVEAKGEIDIELLYESSSTLGRSNVIIDVIVNETHTFAVVITADILPKIARFVQKEIIYEPGDRPYKFVDVFNVINVPISFFWKYHDSSFEFFPKCGTIPAHCHITCMIMYTPSFTSVSSLEVSLNSENKYHQNLYLVAEVTVPKLIFKPQEVTFKDIPINTEVVRTITLANLENKKVTFYVVNKEPLIGIQITPGEGTLDCSAEQTFTIRVKFLACLSFHTKVEIELAMSESVEFNISGNVVFPKVTFNPAQIRLRRIVPDSFDREEFTITNNSVAKTIVDFNFGDFPEFFILTECEFNPSLKIITRVELYPNEHRKLFLHFKALDACSYCFYLPYIINEVYGPPYYNDSMSLNPLSYTQKTMEQYQNFREITPVGGAKMLETIKVICKVGGDSLRISKLRLKFKYFPNSSYISETESKLKFWNSSKDTCKFCIRTDDVCYPFFISYHNGNEVEVLQYSIVCVLGPAEWVEFIVEFLPKTPGTYQIKLPIYLKNYLDCHVFNNLFFEGIYPPPTITASCDEIYFHAVPLQFESNYELELNLEYHSEDCFLISQLNVPQLAVHIDKNRVCLKRAYLQKVGVKLKFWSRFARSFDSVIKFYCSCEAELNIRILGCADNCVLTTYAFTQAYVKWLQNSIHPNSLTTLMIPNYEIEDAVSDFTPRTSRVEESSEMFDYSTSSKENTYPEFPKDTNLSDYAFFMRNTLAILEDWMFEQVFYCRSRHKIPEGIAAIPISEVIVADDKKFQAYSNKKGKEDAPPTLPKYLDLLKTLVGPEINDLLKIKPCPEENNQRVNYTYNFYSNAIKFIESRGGLYVRVYPEFLLERNDYLTFIEKVVPQREDCEKFRNVKICDEETHYLLSKQTWLDLLFQTYKVLVLARIRMPKEFTEVDSNETNLSIMSMDVSNNSSTSQETRASPNQANTKTSIKEEDSRENIFMKDQDSDQLIMRDLAFWQEYNQAELTNTNIYGVSERILLFWLQYHFNENKNSMCKKNKFNEEDQIILSARKVKFFDYDLIDGLVLIGVTYGYCPYLIPHLNQIYLHPLNVEEMLHNASKLIQSWDMLKLSFSITPLEIIYPNVVKMVMLVSYLYEVLPTFFPAQTFKFPTGLGDKSSQTFKINNLSDFRVSYTVTCFRNEREMFSASNAVLLLQPRQKGTLRITFFAKYAITENVTLMLNGETPKYNYAKSIVLTLSGESLINYATTTFRIPSPLYELLEITSQIQAPYVGEAVYDIFFVPETALSLEDSQIKSWEEDRLLVMPKRLVVNNGKLICDELGIGNLNITLCTLVNCIKEFRILFRNEHYGDFITSIISLPETKNKLFETIIVTIPRDFNNFRCSCKQSQNPLQNTSCPKSVPIRIPCRNFYLWAAAEQMMMSIVDERDRGFWKKYLGTNVGIMLKNWLLSDPLHTSVSKLKLFQTNVTYEITVEPFQDGLTFPLTTTIKNVFNSTTHELLFHYGEETKAQNIILTFESHNNLECRHYKVVFTTPEEEESTIYSYSQN